MNPNNAFINNIAGGSDYIGFSFEMEEDVLRYQRKHAPPQCQAQIPTLDQLRSIPLGQFSGNRAHSMPHAGIWMSKFWAPLGPTAVLKDFKAYKIYGVELPHDLGRSACVLAYTLENVRVEDLVCADAIRGFFDREGTAVINALMVGYTNNIGTGRATRIPGVGIAEYGE
eukprot:jgi/Chrzof1/9225/Cz03g40170.t1